jgi:hypothetical protein
VRRCRPSPRAHLFAGDGAEEGHPPAPHPWPRRLGTLHGGVWAGRVSDGYRRHERPCRHGSSAPHSRSRHPHTSPDPDVGPNHQASAAPEALTAMRHGHRAVPFRVPVPSRTPGPTRLIWGPSIRLSGGSGRPPAGQHAPRGALRCSKWRRLRRRSMALIGSTLDRRDVSTTRGAADGRIDRHGSAHPPLVVAAERPEGPVASAIAPWLPEPASLPPKLSASRPVCCHGGRRQPGSSFPMFHKCVPARPWVASRSLGTGAVHQM